MTPYANDLAKPMPIGQAQSVQGQVQRNVQAMVPNQGQYNGNPRGANNMGQSYGYAPTPYNMNYQGGQSSQLGRYTPPTMQQGSAFLQQGLYNSNQWNNQGGYQYNLPNSYGQTGLNYQQGMAMYPQFQQGGYGQIASQFGDASRLPNMQQYDQAMVNRQDWMGANSGVGAAPVPSVSRTPVYSQERADALLKAQWEQVLAGRRG